jgi:biotin transport system substrate-specific component
MKKDSLLLKKGDYMAQNFALNLRMVAYASLFTALTIIGSYISIPISSVPIVLANFFVMLAGLLLGKWWASGSVGLYLLLGALGFPVFAGGTGGMVHLVGPTGGYLFGYLACAFVIGFITEKGQPSWVKDLIALIVGLSLIFALGVPWLKVSLKFSWSKAFAAGMLPFLIGAAIKIAAALVVVRPLRPILNRAIANQPK